MRLRFAVWVSSFPFLQLTCPLERARTAALTALRPSLSGTNLSTGIVASLARELCSLYLSSAYSDFDARLGG